MRAKKPIGVILNLPDTPEGMERFNQAMDAFNSRLVAYVLNKYPISRAQKRAYIASLNGIPPWAPKETKEEAPCTTNVKETPEMPLP